MPVPNPGIIDPPEGENVDEWWVIAPAGESQGTALHAIVPAGTVITDFLSMSPQSAALNNEQQITYNGKPYVRFMGPFATQQEALNAKPAGSGQVLSAILGGIAGAFAGGDDPITAAQTAAAAPSVWDALTSGPSLMRIAEVLLGLILLGVGIAALIKQHTNITIPPIIPV